MARPTFTVIRGGSVIDAHSRRAIGQDFLIENGIICEVGPPGLSAPPYAALIDASDRLLIPGLVNGHMHAHGALAKGLPGDRWPLELLLNSNPALNAHRTVEDKYLCGLLSAVEMVRNGCTACFDMFVEFPLPTLEGVEAVARAYHDVGMRAVVAPMVADRSLYQALPGLMETLPEALVAEVDSIRLAPHEASLEVCKAVLSQWSFDRDRIRPALAPTVPLHCSDSFLAACRDLARDFDVGLQTHLAESKTQAVLGLQRYGRSLTAHLDHLGFLGPTVSAAHGVWLDHDDARRLADTGTAVIHNPLSNMRFGSGLADVRALVGDGVPVGLGTDAANTSDTLNMFEAMRLAAFVSRVHRFDYKTWLGPDEVLGMATAGSARALGFGDRIGRLAPGCCADIVFLDLGHVRYLPLNDALRQIVFSENGAAVDKVMIDGRLVLDAGRILTVNEAGLRHRVEAAALRIEAATAAQRAFADRLEDYVGAFCVAQARRPVQIRRHLDH